MEDFLEDSKIQSLFTASSSSDRWYTGPSKLVTVVLPGKYRFPNWFWSLVRHWEHDWRNSEHGAAILGCVNAEDLVLRMTWCAKDHTRLKQGVGNTPGISSCTYWKTWLEMKQQHVQPSYAWEWQNAPKPSHTRCYRWIMAVYKPLLFNRRQIPLGCSVVRQSGYESRQTQFSDAIF